MLGQDEFNTNPDNGCDMKLTREGILSDRIEIHVLSLTSTER